jgi:hypothetical protein
MDLVRKILDIARISSSSKVKKILALELLAVLSMTDNTFCISFFVKQSRI